MKMTDKPINQFMAELQAAGFDFEFKAERFSDGLQVKSQGWVEEAEFLRREAIEINRINRARRKAWN